MNRFDLLVALAILVLVQPLGYSWYRWRQRKHRYHLRSKDGGIIQVEMLGPFKRRKVRR